MTIKVATGESYKLAKFIEVAFGLVGLDWREDVAIDRGLCRPTDLAVSRGNPSKEIERLGWVAKHQIADIVSLSKYLIIIFQQRIIKR
jgi:GDPmannose 4,6-dehydratase